MKQASDILEKLRTFLLSQDFCNRYKNNEKDFSRIRIFTFHVLFFFILNLIKKSIAIELMDFSPLLIKDVTKSAFSQARSKLSPEAFVEANRMLVTEFYTDNSVKTFCGFVVLAIDGSLIELPPGSPQIEQEYGVATNQTDSKKPMGRTSSLYDVLNGITLDAILGPFKAAERDLAMQHIHNLNSLKLFHNFLLLFDRGYPSVSLIIYLLMNNYHFVMRSNTGFIKEVNEVLRTNKKDRIITFEAKRAGKDFVVLKKLFPGINPKMKFSIRVVIVILSTGEKEILLTTLLDKNLYPFTIFKELYFMRWGVEVEYGFKKGSIEIENFSGLSCTAVKQDFHAAIFIGNVHALFVNDAEKVIHEEEKYESKKYPEKVNKNVSLAILKRDLVEALLNPQICLKAFCYEIIKKMLRHRIPIRAGRSVPRKRRHRSHKYHMNRR